MQLYMQWRQWTYYKVLFTKPFLNLDEHLSKNKCVNICFVQTDFTNYLITSKVNIKHSPHHSKAEGSSATTAAGNRKLNDNNVMEENQQ